MHIEFWSLNHIKDHEVGREKKAKHRSLQDAILEVEQCHNNGSKVALS